MISSFSSSSARIWCSSASLRRLTFKTGSVLSQARRRHRSACSLNTIAPSLRSHWRRSYFFGATQASVTALSMMCRWTLLHCEQENVRKSWPVLLGSIAVNLIGEPQAVHCGPWFCVSSIVTLLNSRSVRRPRFAGEPAGRIRLKGSDAMTLVST
jgi:hypothetical protein